MFVVVAENPFTGMRVFGPYRTAARASGIGYSRFGALTFGCPVKWRVIRVGEK